MRETSLLDRALMLAKTLANSVVWIVALVATLIRGKVRGSSSDS